MTEGKVVSLCAEVCRGWAKIATLPRYAVTVHLVLHGRVQASAIADRTPVATDDPTICGNCWFGIDVPPEAATLLSECRVLVGESGTYLSDAKREGGADTASHASKQPPMSFRDALDRGLSVSDVLELLYLDIMRRPPDMNGLCFFLEDLKSEQGSLERCRRSLLESDEYRGLMLLVRDAPGGTFAKNLAYLSSTRRLEMEQHAEAFQCNELPLRHKLLEFLPGIVAVPNAIEALFALADKGLPERELFFRALSTLSHQPSLIVASGRQFAPSSNGDNRETASDDKLKITFDCASPLFIQGWNKLERSPSKMFRWMEQVGLLLSPRAEWRVKQLEVSVEGWYGGLDQRMTAVAGGTVLVCERREMEGGGATLIFKSPDASPITASRFALVASAIACPWSYDGTPDTRLVSCQVSAASFQYEGRTA